MKYHPVQICRNAIYILVSLLFLVGCGEGVNPYTDITDTSASTLGTCFAGSDVATIEEDVLLGQEFCSGGSTTKYGTMPNYASFDLTQSWPGAGYVDTFDNAPSQNNLCSGTSVLGVDGNQFCQDDTPVFGDYTGSNVHRTVGSAQITLTGEQAVEGALTSPYREIPVINLDDEGQGSANGGSSTVTAASRPDTSCGDTQETVATRIADCLTKNPTTATWDGAENGNGGQATWKLVTYDGTYEVWWDERTQLLWSDGLGVVNWCKASGNADAGTNCKLSGSGGTLQGPTATSWCAELADPPPSLDKKGGLYSGTTPAVYWRLPTRADWLQAELDGIRFVLSNMGAVYWTATPVGNSSTQAWIFDGTNGSDLIQTFGFVTWFNVRCVGRTAP